MKSSLENTVSLDLVMGDSYMPFRRIAETVLTVHMTSGILPASFRTCAALCLRHYKLINTADILLTLSQVEPLQKLICAVGQVVNKLKLDKVYWQGACTNQSQSKLSLIKLLVMQREV